MSDAPWSVTFERRADRDIGRLDPPVRQRVTSAIEQLAVDPDRATGVRRLSGRPAWRLRVGDWRVIFQLDREARAITVARVLPRGRAYQR